MDRAAHSRAARHASAGVRAAALLIVGARPGDALSAWLARTFGAAARVEPHLPPPDNSLRVDLALVVDDVGDSTWQRALAVWAHAAQVPALAVELSPNRADIGALTWPGRAGCGECARQRRLAAAAARCAPAGGSPRAGASHEVIAAAGPAVAREVRAILRRGPQASRLLDHVLAIDGATGRRSLHRVVPLAQCPVCGGAATAPTVSGARHLSPDAAPEKLLDALAGWVDPLTGVVAGLVVERPEETGVAWPIVATAAPPHVLDADGALRRLPVGWGKGLSVSAAILSAVGEALERYAPSLPDPARVVWRRPDELDGEHLDPRALALYAQAQYERPGFPHARFDPAVRHPWVRGHWLGRGTPVWVPAVCVFLSLDVRPEHLICQGTSNGLAASIDLEDAGLRATLELLERDAFMAAWLGARPGRRLVLDGTLDPALGRVLAGLEALGAAVELYRLETAACGTVVLGLALGDGRQWPGVTLGLGADLDPRLALRQALLELGQTGPHLRRLMRSGSLPVPADAHAVREMLQHASYYFPAERAGAFKRLRGSQAPLVLRDLGSGTIHRSLAACGTALEVAGVRVALVDVTSPDLATGPFRVVRAISPDLQPISFGYGLERMPVERLRSRGLARDVPAIHPIW